MQRLRNRATTLLPGTQTLTLTQQEVVVNHDKSRFLNRQSVVRLLFRAVPPLWSTALFAFPEKGLGFVIL
jgi:hypothetical protein